MRTAYALRRPVRNAYLVRVRDRRRSRDLLVVLAVVLPLAVALLVYTRIHVNMIEAGYRIGVLERQLDEVQDRERALRTEAARLESPERIERLARERLGMVEPTVETTMFVVEDEP